MMFVFVILGSLGLASATTWDVPEQCLPIFECSASFLHVTKYFYENGNLMDVNENTAEEICKHFMEQASCIEDKMDNCSSMAFAVADMKEMTRAFCTEHTSDLVALIPCYNVPNVRSSFVNCVRNSFNDPNTCGFVDNLRNCISMFNECDEVHSTAVDRMLQNYRKPLCRNVKFVIGVPFE